jgi:hypothetical protein
MAINQSQLTPKEQAALFALMQKAGAQPTSGGADPSTEDVQAQQGTGNVDNAGLQQLFGGQQQAPQPAAPGSFKDDPQGAMQHISDTFKSLATGPKLTKTAGGQLQARLPVDQPLLRLFGVKHNVDVNDPNYFQSAQAAGVGQYLPTGLAQTPDGMPFVGKTAYDQALAAKTAGGKKPVYNLEQYKVLRNPDATDEQIKSAFPNGLPQDVVSDQLRSQGMNDIMTRHNEGQWDKFTKDIAPGLVRGNTAIGIEARKYAAGNHALSLFQQIRARGEGADPREQLEAAISVASMLMTNGTLAQGEVEGMLPKTWRNISANWQEFLLNNPTSVEAQKFMDRLETTTERQKGVAEENIKRFLAPVIVGYRHLREKDQSRFDEAVMAAANSAYTVDAHGQVVPVDNAPTGAPAAPQSTPTHPTAATAPGLDLTSPEGIRSAYKSGKLSREQAGALLKGMKR